jgi:hypothetical protein
VRYRVLVGENVVARNLHSLADANDWIDTNLTGSDWFSATVDEQAEARSTDPVTSHDAAASVSDLRGSQQDVLRAFPPLPFGITDEELVAKYRRMQGEGVVRLQSESGIRTRRAELVKKGLVVDSGERRLTTNGRKATVWRTDE